MSPPEGLLAVKLDAVKRTLDVMTGEELAMIDGAVRRANQRLDEHWALRANAAKSDGDLSDAERRKRLEDQLPVMPPDGDEPGGVGNDFLNDVAAAGQRAEEPKLSPEKVAELAGLKIERDRAVRVGDPPRRLLPVSGYDDEDRVISRTLLALVAGFGLLALLFA